MSLHPRLECGGFKTNNFILGAFNAKTLDDKQTVTILVIRCIVSKNVSLVCDQQGCHT